MDSSAGRSSPLGQDLVRKRLAQAFDRRLGRLDRVEFLALSGSMGRGEESANSDVDLVIVGMLSPAELEQTRLALYNAHLDLPLAIKFWLKGPPPSQELWLTEIFEVFSLSFIAGDRRAFDTYKADFQTSLAQIPTPLLFALYDSDDLNRPLRRQLASISAMLKFGPGAAHLQTFLRILIQHSSARELHFSRSEAVHLAEALALASRVVAMRRSVSRFGVEIGQSVDLDDAAPLMQASYASYRRLRDELLGRLEIQ
ncbi:MAG TPA: nucleotidyltransferase domain-containing protein [Allosphingosinicella sp.]|nr:nucleotidyltransferase domain-containing protein [Allosphingosinicella sp.]